MSLRLDPIRGALFIAVPYLSEVSSIEDLNAWLERSSFEFWWLLYDNLFGRLQSWTANKALVDLLEVLDIPDL